jgi:C-terminal peptidase (prc)
MTNKKKIVIWVIVALLVTNTATFIISNYVSIGVGEKYVISKEDYSLLSQFSKMFGVKDILEKKYVDKIDESKLVEGAVRGIAAGIGDPYTVYMDQKEYEAFNVHTEGTYEGIGLTVEMKDNRVTAVAPIEDTPSEKAGIKTGDVIIGVDGKDISGKTLDEVVALLKGKAGTSVKLTILKAGTSIPVEVSITRAKITLITVKDEMLNNNIGYIRITTFDENTAQNFKKALKDVQSKGMKGLILDLRDNPGGLLDQCVQIADELMGQGTIVYTIDNKGQKEVETSDKNKINVPLAILVNGGTASASEIVSGAVKDTNSGVLIGTKTFGKGLVQTIIPLTDKSAVKVTIARYYTPSGVCIQGKGIEPNIVIDLPDNLKDKVDLTRQEDVQLNKAIEVIQQKMK